MVKRRAIAAALGLALGTGPAAEAAECRLALVLALDVSSSVDEAEDALQRGGLANALISPSVEAAVFSAPSPVAIAVYEWSGRHNQDLLVDWTMIETRGDLLRVAETVARSTRSYSEFPTALGYALGYGAGLFQRGPDCLYRVLDMAGDGENNEGFPPQAAYAEFPFARITVNGLAVEAGDFETGIGLAEYYEKNVLHGPGAFLEVARGFDDYERAMRRKLERELMPRAVGHIRGPDTTAPPG